MPSPPYGCATPPFVQRIRQVRLRALPRWSQARKDSADNGRRKRECQGTAVQCDVLPSEDVALDFGRHIGFHGLYAPFSECQAEYGAAKREHNAFGNQLSG